MRPRGCPAFGVVSRARLPTLTLGLGDARTLRLSRFGFFLGLFQLSFVCVASFDVRTSVCAPIRLPPTTHTHPSITVTHPCVPAMSSRLRLAALCEILLCDGCGRLCVLPTMHHANSVVCV